MQLPHELQHFPNGALIVVSDTVIAKFYLVGGDTLEELDGVAVPKETGQDGEGSFEFFPDDASRLHAFIHKVVERLGVLVRKHDIPLIHMVMPAEIDHEVTGHLPNDIKEKLGKTIHLNLMKESPLEAVRRIIDVLGLA
jgi:hypothetical protein